MAPPTALTPAPVIRGFAKISEGAKPIEKAGVCIKIVTIITVYELLMSAILKLKDSLRFTQLT